MRIYLLVLITFIASTVFAREEEPMLESRPVTGLYAVEAGHNNVLATYLSPLHYSGSYYGAYGKWTKAIPFNPEKAIMNFNGGFNFSRLLNPAKTATMVGLNGEFSWGMEWRKRLPCDLQFTLGGAAQLKGGAYYLLRNGNNPVQALANISVGVTGSLSYHFKIKNLPILITDDLAIPSLSAFFSSEYGETYYEIYLGNTKGLAHAGWWGNNLQINNLLSVTFDFGRTSAMIGYRFNGYTQWANNLNTKLFTHSLVIGVVPGGIGLKNRKRNTIYSWF